MKLYATVTSERASKGQGGNKFLKVKLLVGGVDNQLDAGSLFVEIKQGTQNEYAVVYYNPPKDGKTITLASITTKGEKQKGEGCIYDHDHKDGSRCDFHSL